MGIGCLQINIVVAVVVALVIVAAAATTAVVVHPRPRTYPPVRLFAVAAARISHRWHRSAQRGAKVWLVVGVEKRSQCFLSQRGR